MTSLHSSVFSDCLLQCHNKPHLITQVYLFSHRKFATRQFYLFYRGKTLIQTHWEFTVLLHHRKVWWAGCSLSRMRLHAWCRALNVRAASCQCYRSCTSFRFEIWWISRWPPSLVYLSLSGTAPSNITADIRLVSDEDRRQLCSATSRTWSWDKHTATMETGVLQIQSRSCGTAFQLKLTLALNGFNA